jgi:hypothetical protein
MRLIGGSLLSTSSKTISFDIIFLAYVWPMIKQEVADGSWPMLEQRSGIGADDPRQQVIV